MTYIGNIDEGQPSKTGAPLDNTPPAPPPPSPPLTSDMIATIEKEVVTGVKKENSSVPMIGEASDVWDAIAKEVRESGRVASYDVPNEVPEVPVNLVKMNQSSTPPTGP